MQSEFVNYSTEKILIKSEEVICFTKQCCNKWIVDMDEVLTDLVLNYNKLKTGIEKSDFESNKYTSCSKRFCITPEEKVRHEMVGNSRIEA